MHLSFCSSWQRTVTFLCSATRAEPMKLVVLLSALVLGATLNLPAEKRLAAQGPPCPRTISDVTDWRKVIVECDGRIWQPDLPPEPRTYFDVWFGAPRNGAYTFNGVSTELWLDRDSDGRVDELIAGRTDGQVVHIQSGGRYQARGFAPNGGFELRPVPTDNSCPRTISDVTDWRKVIVECDGRIWQPLLLPEPRPQFEVAFTAPQDGTYTYRGISTELWLDRDGDGLPDELIVERVDGRTVAIMGGMRYIARGIPPNGGFELVPESDPTQCGVDAHQRRLEALDPTYRTSGVVPWLSQAGFTWAVLDSSGAQVIEESWAGRRWASGLPVRAQALAATWPAALTTDRSTPVNGRCIAVTQSSQLCTDVAGFDGTATVYVSALNWCQLTPSPTATEPSPTATAGTPAPVPSPSATGTARCFPPLSGADPLLAQQWGLQRIQASDAWARTRGSCDIAIAVIDSGVDYSHVDLGSGKILIGIGKDFANDDSDPQDDVGHGTHVAGIAAANTFNEIGIAGVCPQCSILPLKSMDSSGNGWPVDIAAAIRYAADQGASVINLSLGSENCSSDLAEAINYAYDRNVVVIAASGSPRSGGACPVAVAFDAADFAVAYPAALSRVIAVGALDQTDTRSSFSYYGSQLDITAPGRDVLSTVPGNGYYSLTGTSMAAPMVAGTAGLILSQNPSLTPAQVERVLENTADDVGSPGWDAETGWGRVNARRALDATPMGAPPEPPASCSGQVMKSEPAQPNADFVTLYRRIRDEVLAASPHGRRLAGRYYLHGPELAGILLADAPLRSRVADFLRNASDEFESLLPGATTTRSLTPELYSEAETLVGKLEAAASPSLHEAVHKTWAELRLARHIGRDTREIWAHLGDWPVYLPDARR